MERHYPMGFYPLPSLNTRVCTICNGGKDYCGIIEEIYQLTFPGCKHLNHILFKCHWFDSKEKRETRDIGLVEI
jgi:hypothetical protein